MPAFRVVARLDVKSDRLIKGVQMEGLKVLGEPGEFAARYYEAGIDEIWYQDIVASLYNRSVLPSIMEDTVDAVFVPVTIGGGVRSQEDCQKLFLAGADKVCINSACIHNPNLIREIARNYGSQSIAVSIECKESELQPSGWEAYSEAGREPSDLDVVAWAKTCAELGAGELLITSIDRDGTGRGIDINLALAVVEEVKIPVIIGGGFNNFAELKSIAATGVSGLAVGKALHAGLVSVRSIKEELERCGVEVRSASS